MEETLWGLIPWGYQVLLQIELLRTGILDVCFPLITDLGSEIVYLVILSLVYWCVNKEIGKGLNYAFLYTATLNTWLKDLWRLPRPDSPTLETALEQAGITARLTPLRHETSPSFPSGHTQNAVVAWGYLAARFAKRWFWIVAALLVGLIAFSRMYLGVHFPQDIIGGFIIGVLYLAAWLWTEPRLRARAAALKRGRRYALMVLIPLSVLLIHPVDSTATTLGTVIGLGLGFVLESETLHFDVSGSLQQRIVRALVGLFTVGLVYFGLSALFGLFDEQAGTVLELVWRTLRYGLVGFTGGWVAPWAQMRLGVLTTDKEPKGANT
ncbi:MAG: phosphatase PAP2 family protein [Anaerolineae bacterium]